jgi:hypothetical protein
MLTRVAQTNEPSSGDLGTLETHSIPNSSNTHPGHKVHWGRSLYSDVTVTTVDDASTDDSTTLVGVSIDGDKDDGKGSDHDMPQVAAQITRAMLAVAENVSEVFGIPFGE